VIHARLLQVGQETLVAQIGRPAPHARDHPQVLRQFHRPDQVTVGRAICCEERDVGNAHRPQAIQEGGHHLRIGQGQRGLQRCDQLGARGRDGSILEVVNRVRVTRCRDLRDERLDPGDVGAHHVLTRSGERGLELSHDVIVGQALEETLGN